MHARQSLWLALLCAVVCLGSVAVYAQTDQAEAERILGPQWKQHSRQAGMIFSGTVLSVGTAQVNGEKLVSGGLVDGRVIAGGPTDDRPISVTSSRTRAGAVVAIPLRFRVDTAIAGVQAGQVLTIYEWAGYEWAAAESMHPPMQPGEHLLLLLYPRSRLGLTSPVGGAQGQILLILKATGMVCASRPSVSLDQLMRAISGAREGKR
jgi:hypothetical protein